MQIPTLAILAIATVLGAGPARGQTYDRNYPVCLHVYGPIGYFDCGYTSLPQCAVSASGRSAVCEINPYFANAQVTPPLRHGRHRHAS